MKVGEEAVCVKIDAPARVGEANVALVDFISSVTCGRILLYATVIAVEEQAGWSCPRCARSVAHKAGWAEGPHRDPSATSEWSEGSRSRKNTTNLLRRRSGDGGGEGAAEASVEREHVSSIEVLLWLRPAARELRRPSSSSSASPPSSSCVWLRAAAARGRAGAWDQGLIALIAGRRGS
ncbi:hypothetical protein QYE76_007339 [Lolium multiflorum]|uniref:Uncharacterized protein n=1 Tax=Lolium multiflorum TaxID=4521 RepID=A0AAD8RXL6_LOLMU|nr:hypothetical protein QYE76_007339 [Lolium multiflorum]